MTFCEGCLWFAAHYRGLYFLFGATHCAERSPTKSLSTRVSSACEVIVVFQRNETEWLHDFVLAFACRLQDLRHAFYRARFRLEGDLDQIALLQRPGQSQHAAGLGNGLKLCSCAAPVIQLDDHGNRASKLNSLGTMLRVSLGEVCHSQNHYVMAG